MRPSRSAFTEGRDRLLPTGTLSPRLETPDETRSARGRYDNGTRRNEPRSFVLRLLLLRSKGTHTLVGLST